MSNSLDFSVFFRQQKKKTVHNLNFILNTYWQVAERQIQYMQQRIIQGFSFVWNKTSHFMNSSLLAGTLLTLPRSSWEAKTAASWMLSAWVTTISCGPSRVSVFECSIGAVLKLASGFISEIRDVIYIPLALPLPEEYACLSREPSCAAFHGCSSS